MGIHLKKKGTWLKMCLLLVFFTPLVSFADEVKKATKNKNMRGIAKENSPTIEDHEAYFNGRMGKEFDRN